MTTWSVRVDGSDMPSLCLRGFVRATLLTIIRNEWWDLC
jgi:hypothetical protein